MKNLSNVIALSLLLVGNAVMAQEVSVDAAKSHVLEFLSNKTSGPMRAKGQQVSNDLELAYTSKSEAKTCFYVFNLGNDNGFVIAGGDESARQILGYCDHGSFDYETANPAFKWWLGQYKEQIAHAKKNPNPVSAEAPRRAKSTIRYSVEPLIKTKWGQRYPYNSEIPICEPTGERYLTGCVATAMAQIMKYWEYPEKGTGGNSVLFPEYYWNDEGEYVYKYVKTYVDFSTTYYDWDNMISSYIYIWEPDKPADCEDCEDYKNYTEEEAKAMGTLMYHAGVAVNMEYGTEESGAMLNEIPFIEHFGYDESAEDIQRHYIEEEGCYDISNEEWEELIYHELDEERPVMYCGVDHAFICDGYDSENNLFSFNWGWNGEHDGYYSLSVAEDPVAYFFDDSDESDYYSADIIINLKPASFSKEEVKFTTSKQEIYYYSINSIPIILGGSLPIQWTSAYDGTPEFSSSDESVATVDANGVITAVGKGYAEITAYAPSTSKYYRKHTEFGIYVGDVEFAEQPHFNNDNNPYADDCVLYFTLVSQFPILLRGEPVVMEFSNDEYLGRDVSSYLLEPQDVDNHEFDLNLNNQIAKKFVAGNQYNIHFYKDRQDHLPFNYPSLTFTFRNKLTVDYGVSPAGYGTLILPFNAELHEGMTIYSCPSVDQNGVLTLVEESSIERNKPYIVKATYGENYHFEGPEAIDADKPSFQEGILVGAVGKNVPLQKNTDYILQVQDGKAAFYKYTGTKAEEPSENDSSGNRLAKQFRAFLRPEGSSNAPKFNLPGFDEDETESISTLRSAGTMPAGVYSIDGKRQSEFQKGLNILLFEDGTAQKVFVK